MKYVECVELRPNYIFIHFLFMCFCLFVTNTMHLCKGTCLWCGYEIQKHSSLWSGCIV